MSRPRGVRNGEARERMRALLAKSPHLSDAEAGMVLGVSQQAAQEARVGAGLPSLTARRRALLATLWRSAPGLCASDVCAMASEAGMPVHPRTARKHRPRDLPPLVRGGSGPKAWTRDHTRKGR